MTATRLAAGDLGVLEALAIRNMIGHMGTSREKTVRRQARGRTQIDRVLAAAARTFVERGYDATSTNHIAAAAGISPGSLYQFFANKEEVAVKLAERYAADIAGAHAKSLDALDLYRSPMGDVIHAIVSPIDNYRASHGAFVELFLTSRLPDRLSEPVGRVEGDFEKQVTAILCARNPTKDTEEVRAAASVAFALFRGYVSRTSARSIPLQEIEIALYSYFTAKGLE